MSDPGIDGPISEFEDRCIKWLANSASLRELIGASNVEEATTGGRILNWWDSEEGEEPPEAPVVFIAPQQDQMRISTEANADGIVGVSIYGVCPDEFDDTNANRRRWFANQVGNIVKELVALGEQANSELLRIAKHDPASDGFWWIGGPALVNDDPIHPKHPTPGKRALIAEFYVQLEL